MPPLSDEARRRAEDLISRLEAVDTETLSPARRTFLNSLLEQWEARAWLSDTQLDRLEEVLDELDLGH